MFDFLFNRGKSDGFEYVFTIPIGVNFLGFFFFQSVLVSFIQKEWEENFSWISKYKWNTFFSWEGSAQYRGAITNDNYCYFEQTVTA